MTDEGAATEAPGSQTQREYWLELIASVLMAIAIVCTAYSAWQATRWGGVQATAFAESGSLRNQSVAALSTANTQISYDATTYGQFVFRFRDQIRDDEDLAEARELADSLMRDEFLVYLDEWLALDPLNDPDAPRTPFELDDFSNERLEESQQLVDQAEVRFEEARDANQTGDDYILATVFFASVLFFTGISSKFTRLNLRTVILILAAAGLGFGMWRMVTLPFE